MQEFEYRVIPAPRRAKRVKGAKTGADKFARTLADVINLEAQDGWEYLRVDTLPMDEKKGMLSSFSEVYQTVLIFRRLQEAEAAPEREPAPSAGLRMRAEPEEPKAPMSLGPASGTPAD